MLHLVHLRLMFGMRNNLQCLRVRHRECFSAPPMFLRSFRWSMWIFSATLGFSGGRDQDAFPFPAIALKDEVSASSASDKFMADCDGNLRNPFLGIATNYQYIGFQSWLCTTKANISEATASGHAFTLNCFLGLFTQTTDEANLIHFLMGLEESKVLQTLFRSWH